MIFTKQLMLRIFTIPFLIFSACSSSEPTKQIEGKADMHTSQLSLDWSGVYLGELPCANCSYIETKLSISNDLTFELITKHIGNKDEFADTLKGSFSWNENQIILSGIPTGERAFIFKVEENRLRQLDLEGKEINGDLASDYILLKQ